jgi:hypothetical protein
MLAHVSPDEAHLMDYLQGGTRVNPHTGLPEYGLFGNILKAVARAAAAIAGFTYGGPLGAAAASAAATKLTGGSWNDALKAAALSGAGSELGQGISGAGWNVAGYSNGLNSAASSLDAAGSIGPDTGSAVATGGTTSGTTGGAAGIPSVTASVPDTSEALSTPLGGTPAATAGSVAAPTGLSSVLSHIGGYGGLGAGMGSLAVPLPIPGAAPAPQQSQFSLPPVTPNAESYIPYTGNPLTYGETGGQHTFLSNVNPLTPPPNYMAAGGQPQGLGAMASSTLPPMQIPFDIQGFASGGASTPATTTPDNTSTADDTLNLPLVTPFVRKYIPYTGDPLHYAETGGVHQFLDNVNPLTAAIPAGVAATTAAQGAAGTGNGVYIPGVGMVNIPTSALNGTSTTKAAPSAPAPVGNYADYLTHGAGWTPNAATPAATPAAAPQQQTPSTPAGLAQLSPQYAALLKGFNAMAKGGAPHEGQVSGPGGPREDLVPAQLSNGEHVATAAEINRLGGGNNERGQKRMYKLRRIIKKNPQKIIKAINKTAAHA